METHVILVQCALVAKDTTGYYGHSEHIRIAIRDVINKVIGRITPGRANTNQIVRFKRTTFAAQRRCALGLFVPGNEMHAEPIVTQRAHNMVYVRLEYGFVNNIGAGTPVVVSIFSPHP